MQANIKHALVLTATVLVTLYVLRQVPVASDLVSKALNG
jgi:hypothetical protein